jgi:hypothetical protein
MKTALQEWIEWLKAYEYELPLELQIKAKELLEKEKEQIIKAMTYSTYREWKGISVSNEQYYNQTYNDATK